MDIIQLLGAFGFGAFAVKLLDIVWLKKVEAEAERIKWIREKRLEAYSELISEVLTLGTDMKSRKNAYTGHVLASKSILLIDDDTFSVNIKEFFLRLERLDKSLGNLQSTIDDDIRKENEKEYYALCEESNNITEQLRKSLRGT